MKLKQLLLGGAAFALVGFVALLADADSARAGTFNPSLEIAIVNPEAGANSDWTADFNLPAGDVNFAAVVFFIPPEWDVTPGDEIPIGTVVGKLTASATLGLINSACFQTLPVIFTMLNASIDPSDTVDYLDTDENDLPDYFEDVDNSGLQDGLEKYPDFITRVLDDVPGDEVGNPLKPIRRSAGIQIVAGVEVLLQFLIFEPGTFIDERISNDPELGYPSVTLLQNIGDPDFDPIPSAISDFCTPLLSSNTSFGVSKDNACTDVPGAVLEAVCEVTSAPLELEEGVTSDPDEGGIPVFTNPEEGTYTFTTIAAGQRDADGDGIQNSLDVCPFVANEGDPTIQGDGDADGDGLDAACDPNDDPLAEGTASDEDLDGYLNRQDNCPLVANGEEGTNQRDQDDDTIGDDCDPNPCDAETEGELTIVEVSQDVTIGPGGGARQWHGANDYVASISQGIGRGQGSGVQLERQDQQPIECAPSEAEDGGGLGAGAIIGIVIGIVAAIVVLGGGAFYFMRRGSA